jgi:AcrR family transcriptional regulator
MATADTTALSTPEALVVAGRNAFAERGYAGSSLTQITKNAGLTTGAFYRHFTSKAEFSALLFAAYRNEVERSLARGRSLRAQIEAWLLVARQHRGAVRVSQELMLVEAAEAESYRELCEAATQLVARRLDRRLAEHDRELAARMVVNVIAQYIVMESASWIPQRDARAVAIELDRLCRRGLYRR